MYARSYYEAWENMPRVTHMHIYGATQIYFCEQEVKID